MWSEARFEFREVPRLQTLQLVLTRSSLQVVTRYVVVDRVVSDSWSRLQSAPEAPMGVLYRYICRSTLD